MRLFRRALTWLLVTLSLTGCAGLPQCPNPKLPHVGRAGVDVHVYIESDFTAKERNHIIDGMTMWERATNGLVVWHLIDHAPETVNPVAIDASGTKIIFVSFRRVTSMTPWVKEWDENNKPRHLLGLMDPRYPKTPLSLWLVEDRLTDNSGVIVAAHEFGHAIGLPHVTDKASVMSELHNAAVKRLTCHDLKALCDKYDCDARNVCSGTPEQFEQPR